MYSGPLDGVVAIVDSCTLYLLSAQCSSLDEMVFFFYLLVFDCYKIKRLEGSSRYRAIVSYRSGKILSFLFFSFVSSHGKTRRDGDATGKRA